MPLIDKLNDTALRSLKYEKDLPGGGSSGLPYSKTDINTIDEGFNRFRLTKFDDGFTRGGTVGALNAAVTDTIRIGKMFTDLPKGPLFLARQVGLQLSNPRIETKQIPKVKGTGFFANLINAGLGVLNDAKIGPTRIYNLGVNTLAQVPVNAFGGHIVRHGLTPIQNEQTKYETVVRDNDKLKDSKLLRLTRDMNINSPDNQNTKSGLSNVLSKVVTGLSSVFTSPSNILNTLNNNRPQTIETYFGGPNSVYGIGFTTIKRTSYTGYDNNGKVISNKQLFSGEGKINYVSLLGLSNNYFTSTPTPTAASFGLGALAPLINSSVNTAVQIQDKNNVTLSQPTNKPSQIDRGKQTSYINLRTEIENTIFKNAGRPKVSDGIKQYIANEFNTLNVHENHTGLTGGITFENTQAKIAYSNEVKGDDPIIIKYNWKTADRAVRVGSGRQDTINLTPLFTAPHGQDSLAVNINNTKYTINDLVKFRIEAVDTDTPANSTFMVFRAYLTSLSDASSPKWTSINYVGRGEDFYIYNGFSRKINIGFKVAALSSKEMEPMYQKLNYLMSNTMPDYSQEGLMRGPFMRMTVGNWIDSQPGIMNDLTYTVNNDSPWEIALNEPLAGGSRELILPHIVEVSMTFTPIGTQYQKDNLVSKKSAQQSNIAQNYNGASPSEYNYIRKDYKINAGSTATLQ